MGVAQQRPLWAQVAGQRTAEAYALHLVFLWVCLASVGLPSLPGFPLARPQTRGFQQEVLVCQRSSLLLGELWIIAAALDGLRFLQAGIPSLLCGIHILNFFLPLLLHPSLL